MTRLAFPYESVLRRLLVLCLASVLALALATLTSPPLTRAATTCSSEQHNFDGVQHPTGGGLSNTGVGASVNTMTPALCTTGASWADSSIWVMDADNTLGNGGYAQVGYLRHHGDSTVYYFTEYRKNYNTTSTFNKYGTASGTHSYRDLYNYTTGHIDMWLDSTKLASTNFDPIVEWTSPWSPQWFGETHDPGDDIAGTSSSPVYYSSLCIVTSRSGGCSTTPSGLVIYDSYSRYHIAWDTTNSKFHVWT